MKKNLSVILMLMLSFSLVLAACGGGGGGGSTTNQSDSSSGDTGAAKAKPIKLTISSFLPGPHVQHVQVIEPFIADLERVTEGRVTAELQPGGALGAPNAQYDLAVTGVADMALSIHGYTPGKFPLTSVIEIPQMSSTNVETTRILTGLQKNIPGIVEEHEGTKIGWLFTVGPYDIFTKDKPVRTIEDLKGMKIRTTGPSGNALLEAYGAVPVNMPMGEVYEGIQKGVIDGALAPISAVYDYQMQDVSKYITRGNFINTSWFVVINPKTWEKISAEDQQAIEVLIEELPQKAAQAFDDENVRSLKLAEEAGVEIYELSKEEMVEWKSQIEHLAEQWVEEMESKGLPGREVYEEAVRLRDQGE